MANTADMRALTRGGRPSRGNRFRAYRRGAILRIVTKLAHASSWINVYVFASHLWIDAFLWMSAGAFDHTPYLKSFYAKWRELVGATIGMFFSGLHEVRVWQH